MNKTVRISLEAETDLADGFWFYEKNELGLGGRFRSSVKTDIRSLEIHGGTHSKRHGYHRLVCKTFPFSVFYEMESENSLVIVAVFGQRRGAEWIANRLKNDGG